MQLRGGQRGSRTLDTRIFSPLLYQLSYLAVGVSTRGLIYAKWRSPSSLCIIFFGNYFFYYVQDAPKVRRADHKECNVADRLRGVNLSGWLIVEPWVTPSLFAATGATTEEELLRVLGERAYQEKIRKHYDTFVFEDDFRRMEAAGFNSVRIPVPWHVFEPEEGATGEVTRYVPCADYLDRALGWAADAGISVLLDLATVPGGQGDSNGTPSTPNTAEWHSSTRGRQTALNVLEGLARRFGSHPALFGIELLDSPLMRVRKGLNVTDGIPAHYLRNFYREAYELVRAHMSEDKAVVFSASGYPGAWKHFMRQDRYRNDWIDVHLYHYPGENAQDISTPQGLKQALARNHRVLRAATSTKFNVLVGEWSAAAVLPDAAMTPEGRIAYERVFVSSQLASFEAAGGWFFQTWKTERRIPAWDARVSLSSFERGMME